MQQPCRQQLAYHKACATGRMKMIYIGAAIGINARQQRHHRRQRIKIIPVDDDAGRARNRDQMNGVIGRAACREQSDDGIDDRALIDHFGNRRVLISQMRNRGNTPRGRRRQRVAQWCVGRGERSPRKMQPHHFHQ